MIEEKETHESRRWVWVLGCVFGMLWRRNDGFGRWVWLWWWVWLCGGCGQLWLIVVLVWFSGELWLIVVWVCSGFRHWCWVWIWIVVVSVAALMEDLVLWWVSVDCGFRDCSGLVLCLSWWFSFVALTVVRFCILVVGCCFVLCRRREVRFVEYGKKIIIIIL